MDIPAGEFLSYDYRFDTRQDKDKFICRCGANNCRGTMKSSNGKNKVGGLSTSSSTTGQGDGQGTQDPETLLEIEKRAWEQAKKTLARDQAFVQNFYIRQEERRSQVNSMVPGYSNHDEMVSNGVQNRNRGRYTPHVFLWRNAVTGSDFAARFGKLTRKEKNQQLNQQQQQQPAKKRSEPAKKKATTTAAPSSQGRHS